MDSHTNLERLKTLLLAGVALPDDLRHWVLSGLDKFETGECNALCIALGLRKRGLSSFETRRRIDERNALIKQISLQYESGIAWTKAGIIAQNIKRFPRIEEKALYSTLISLEPRYKIKPPSQQAIYKILTKSNSPF